MGNPTGWIVKSAFDQLQQWHKYRGGGVSNTGAPLPQTPAKLIISYFRI